MKGNEEVHKQKSCIKFFGTQKLKQYVVAFIRTGNAKNDVISRNR